MRLFKKNQEIYDIFYRSRFNESDYKQMMPDQQINDIESRTNIFVRQKIIFVLVFKNFMVLILATLFTDWSETD
mgnify:CR=1 FL=1|jgi:hypothetical protein